MALPAAWPEERAIGSDTRDEVVTGAGVRAVPIALGVPDDHHAALGVDPTEYDHEVFRITSEISRQVYPVVLNTGHADFRAGFEKLRLAAEGIAAAGARGGISGALGRVKHLAAAASSLIGMYFLPVEKNPLPDTVRLSPAW